MSEECTKKLTFSEQYKHPLWQKKRLEILEFSEDKLMTKLSTIARVL
jgi:predicted house-cleaning noncanonical NTP pyrophosphatase (MazG superfamily)